MNSREHGLHGCRARMPYPAGRRTSGGDGFEECRYAGGRSRYSIDRERKDINEEKEMTRSLWVLWSETGS